MIHKTAIVDSSAVLGTNVEVGPYSVIGSDVTIGEGTIIGPHVLIESDTRIGKNNKISHGASIGGPPQDLSFKDQKTSVKIGDGNIIREYVTIHKATKDGTATTLGDNNYVMAYAHLGHDVKVGNSTILANGTGLAGFVQVDDRAVISAYVGVHQFTRIGKMVMIGALARINQDVLPFTMVEGNPASTRGLNVVGLRRNGVGADTRNALKRAYKILCRSGLSISNALSRIEEEVEGLDEVRHLVSFVRDSKRGIII